jgi:hypothetical protein
MRGPNASATEWFEEEKRASARRGDQKSTPQPELNQLTLAAVYVAPLSRRLSRGRLALAAHAPVFTPRNNNA